MVCNHPNLLRYKSVPRLCLNQVDFSLFLAGYYTGYYVYRQCLHLWTHAWIQDIIALINMADLLEL